MIVRKIQIPLVSKVSDQEAQKSSPLGPLNLFQSFSFQSRARSIFSDNAIMFPICPSYPTNWQPVSLSLWLSAIEVHSVVTL